MMNASFKRRCGLNVKCFLKAHAFGLQLLALTGEVVESFGHGAQLTGVIGASIEGYRPALFPVWPSASCQKW